MLIVDVATFSPPLQLETQGARSCDVGAAYTEVAWLVGTDTYDVHVLVDELRATNQNTQR